MKRHKRTAVEWRKIQQNWEKSGKSQIDFCKETGIPITSFTRWRTKLNSKENPGNGLVKLEKKKDGLSANILIQTDYCKIAVSGNENTQSLCNLLKAIKEAAYADRY
jgi:hypothetical protein